MRGGVVVARTFEAIAEAVREARSHFIGALAPLAKQFERAAETTACTEFVNAAAQNENAIAHLFDKRFAKIVDVLIEFAAGLHDEFRGSGGSGRANVRDKIGDGEIGFVADTGDDGNFRIENGTSDDLFVEGPEILHRAAAAGENQDIDKFSLIEKS